MSDPSARKMLEELLRLRKRNAFLEDWRRYKEQSLKELEAVIDAGGKSLQRAQRALDEAAERLLEGDAASKMRGRACQESARELVRTRSALLQQASKVLTDTQPIEPPDDPN